MSVFCFLRVVSKSLAEISMPIGAVLELCSCANLPCFVKLALRVKKKGRKDAKHTVPSFYAMQLLVYQSPKRNKTIP